MGFSRRYLPWMACVAIAATALPALAWGQDPPSSASIVVTDYAFRDAAGEDSTVEIAAGGTVNFSYPSGNTRHNVQFISKQPTSCTQTAGDIWHAVAAAAVVHAGSWLGRQLPLQRARDLRVPLGHELRDDGHRDRVVEHADADAHADGRRPPRRRRRPPRRRRPTPTPTRDSDARRRDRRRRRDADAPPRRRRPPRPARAPRSTRTTRRRRTSGTGSRTRSSSDPADNSVTIDPGGTVDFALPGGRGHARAQRGVQHQPDLVRADGRHRARAAAAAAARRLGAGLGGQLHLQHARHVHVLLLDAPGGDDGQRRRQGGGEPTPRRRRPPRPRRPRSRRATPRRRRSPRRGRRSTSRRRRR